MMAEVMETNSGAKASSAADSVTGQTSVADGGGHASSTGITHITPTTLFSTTITSPGGAPATVSDPLTSRSTHVLPSPGLTSIPAGSAGIISSLVTDVVVPSSLGAHNTGVITSLASGSVYNTSVITTLASGSAHNDSVMTTQAHGKGQHGAPVKSSKSSGGQKGKKSSRKVEALLAGRPMSVPVTADGSLTAEGSAGLDADLTGSTPHKLLQAVRSTSLPFPLPVPTYSQTVQAARASGNVLAERATIVRETVKFFLTHKYWWTTEDYDRIAELVVNEFPELRDTSSWPVTSPSYLKVRQDLSMCARNIRRITKNQEKRRGSPVQNSKVVTESKTPTTEPAPKVSKSGGKGRRKSNAAPSVSVPTMVTLPSAAQMLPHTAHTSAMHTAAALQDPKEVSSLPYLLTSTTPVISSSTPTPTITPTVLPPVAHFLEHPSAHSHTTGGIVFPSLLPLTTATTTTASHPSPTVTSAPAPKLARTEEGGASTESGFAADNALSLSGAWRPDAQLPDPLPVPPYSEKVMKAKKTGVTKYERPLIIRETVLFFLSLKYWWSSGDYDRISHFLVEYFPDLKDPTLSPNMPPNRRVRTDLSQTARNIRRREVMLRRRDSRSPEDRFTAVGTVSLPSHSAPQGSNDFCNELLAAANFIESRTAALHQRDVAKALELHAQVSRDLEASTTGGVITHTHNAKMSEPPVAQTHAEKETDNNSVSASKEMSDTGKYLYNYAGNEAVEGGGDSTALNTQLAVVKQEVGEVGVEQYQQQVLQSQAWLSQALSMQAMQSLTGLSAHVSQALSAAHLSDHLLSSHSPSLTSHVQSPAPPAAHQSTGATTNGMGGSSTSSLSQVSLSVPPLSQPSAYTLSPPTTTTTTTSTSLSDSNMSEASAVDRMSAMAIWRSTCLPDPLPVPPYSLNVVRARDSGNTASARPRIIRETTQFFLAHKMWWTTQDYERIAELVLRQFPQLKTVQNIKKDLGTCARNMRRRLPMLKNKQWASYQSPTQGALKEGSDGVGLEGSGVTLGELATMASLRDAQDKSRGDSAASLVSLAEDPRHSLLAQYEQSAWNVYYQQQFSTPDPATVLPTARSNKRSLSDTTGGKGYEMGEELAEALKQAVVQSVKQLTDTEPTVRRHSVDVTDGAKVKDIKQELAGKSNVKPSGGSKSDNYPVMKELISHPALSVRDPKVTTDSPAFHTTRTAHVGSVVGEGGTGAHHSTGSGGHHPTPARAHSQPACPLRSEVGGAESEEVPMNLTCQPGSETSKQGKSPKAIKSEKTSKKGGGSNDAFSAREQVWFPHGSPWKKSGGQDVVKALPDPLPPPKYSQKLVKAREEGLAYRHRAEIIRETARFFLGFKYWWSSADYSRISELVVDQFPDLKDPVSQPGQPCYRRVQRDLSMCARNLRRKNTRQQQISSGDMVAVAPPKKAKGGSKEKKGKKGVAVKVEVVSQPLTSGMGVGEGSGVVAGVSIATTTSLSLPTVTASNSGPLLTQAMLQASVDHNLTSVAPLTPVQPTALSSTSLTWTGPESVSSGGVLPHLLTAAINSTPLTLPYSAPAQTSVGAAHSYISPAHSVTQSATHSPLTTAHLMAPSSVAAQLVAHSAAQSVSVVMSHSSGAPGKDSSLVGANKAAWPATMVGSAPNNSSHTSTKATGKKKSGGTAGTSKTFHTTPKSSSNVQPKAVKPLAPSTQAGTASHKEGEKSGSSHARSHAKNGESGAKGKTPTGSGAVAHTNKKSKDSGRHLASRTGHGDRRTVSNTTAVVTPTLSEAHASASSSRTDGGVSDKVYINPEHGSELQSQLTKLWQEGKFLDASLEVDNYRLPAHKLVLLAASPYLQSTFRHANPTSHLEVNLPRDTGVDAARDFLKYVYQGVLHISPTTVHALRRIAAMLQIEQLLTYCDDYLQQLSTPVAASVGVARQGHTALSHPPSQVRRVSVNLRDPTSANTHGHPLTSEHNTTTLTSTTLPTTNMQVPAGTAHYVSSQQRTNSRKRPAGALAVPADCPPSYNIEGKGQDQGVLGSVMDRQQDVRDPLTGVSLPKRFRPSQEEECTDVQAMQTTWDAQNVVLNSSHNPADNHQQQLPLEEAQASGRQTSVLAQHLAPDVKGHVRPHTSSVIHRVPNLTPAPSVDQHAGTSSVATTSTTSSNHNSCRIVDQDGVVHYFTNSLDPSEAAVQGEEGVLVRLLPQDTVSMEVGDAMQLQASQTMHLAGDHAIQLAPEHSVHLAGEQGLQLSGDHAIQLATEQQIELSGQPLSTHTIQLTDQQAMQLNDQQTIQLTDQQTLQLSREQAIQLSREQAIQLSEEQALQLSEQQLSQHTIHLSDHHLATGEPAIQLIKNDLSEQQYQLSQQQLAEQQLAEQQQMAGERQLVSGEGVSLADQSTTLYIEQRPETGEHTVQDFGDREGRGEDTLQQVGMDGQGAESVIPEGSDPALEAVGEGRGQQQFVVQGEEVLDGEEVMEEGGEVIVQEVIVESGDLLQDVEVAACETVECSLLPQTYCSSPERQGEEGGVIAGVGEGGSQAENALQNLASQWVRQQYAHTTLDPDTARQFVAALQERMYGQTSTTASPTPTSVQLPASYQEALYVQTGADGETVYVRGEPSEGAELVVETSVAGDSPPQPTAISSSVIDDDDGNQGSLLPQTYCSSPPHGTHSPSVDN